MSKITIDFYKTNARKAVAKRIDNRLKRIRKPGQGKLKSLLQDYHKAIQAINDFDLQTIIAQEIKHTTLKSYCLHGDKNFLSPTVILHYIRKLGKPLDVQADDLTAQYGILITTENLIDFINAHQTGRGGFFKFQELETVKHCIKKITGFNPTTDFVKVLNKRYNPTTFTRCEKQHSDIF